MLCFRTRNTFLVDLMINHPSVRSTFHGDGDYPLVSAKVLSDDRNVCLAGEGGLALFVWQGPARYEGHIAQVNGHRGGKALAFGRAALSALPTHTEVATVTALVPCPLRGARWYVRRLGFISKGLESCSNGILAERFEMEIS